MEMPISNENPRDDITLEDRLAIIEAGGMEPMIHYHSLPRIQEENLSLQWMTAEYEP